MSSVRSLVRSARAAPWGAAAPLSIVMSVVLVVGLVVADGGGWQLTVVDFGARTVAGYLGLDDGFATVSIYTQDGGFSVSDLIGEWGAAMLLFVGALFLVAFGLLAATAASCERRVLAAFFIVLMGVALAGWTGLTDARLGYTTVVLREARSPSTGAGKLAVAITMSAVVGLLLGAALLVATWWAVSGASARRRGAPTPRPRWGASAAIVLVAALVALPLPRLGLWLRDAGRWAFGGPSDTQALIAGSQQAVYLFVAAAIALGLTSALLPRRAPALALASTVVLAALWLPSGWIVGGLLPDALVGSGPAILVFWSAWIAAGTLAALIIASRTTPEPNPT